MTQGTMELIQTVTVTGATQAAIEFTNIPQTYDDLVIKLSIRGDRASVDTEAYIQFNNNTSNYSHRVLFGTGSTAGSANAASYAPVLLNAANSTGSTFSSAEVYIPNYRGSTNKSLSSDSVSETNATGAYQYLVAGLWSNSAAITSIKFTPSTNSFVQHSTATLYGITRVPAGAKATGGVIYDDANFFYHVFTSSGTFTPSQSLSCDVLVVAGGGGSGWHGGGGGGAGGLLGFNSQALTAQNYTITVGAGGAGGVSSGYPDTGSAGRQGSNSIFGALTTAIGGGGGHGTTYPGTTTLVNGGSGGGQSGREVGQNIGTGTSGQGNNGGAGSRVSPNANEPSGGGGGAGAVGGNASSSFTGSGGNGVSTYSSWGLATNAGQNISGTVWFAGGGAGGNWGSGTSGGSGGNGGGASAPNSSGPGVSGTANTGGGASGGVGTNSAAGNGGSGIVIVRYAK